MKHTCSLPGACSPRLVWLLTSTVLLSPHQDFSYINPLNTLRLWASLVAQTVKNLPAVQETCLIPGLGRSPGEGHGNPLQYSCLENPMDRGSWWPTVHGVAESDTTEQISTATLFQLDKLRGKFLLLLGSCLVIFLPHEIPLNTLTR